MPDVMPFTLADIGCGFLLPLGIAWGLARAIRSCTACSRSPALRNCLPIVTGIQAGYWSLSLGPVTPTSHWHWLIYATLFAALIQLAASRIPLVNSWRRRLVYVLGSLLIAHLILPNWPQIQPWRNWLVALWSLIVMAQASLPIGQDSRLSARTFPVIYTSLSFREATLAQLVPAYALALLLTLSGSLRFGQIAGLMAAALTGLSLFQSTTKSDLATNSSDANGPSTYLITLFLWGAATIGYLNSFSQIWLISYLLIPAAPLTAHLVRTSTTNQTVVRPWLNPLAICLLAILLAMIAEYGNRLFP